VAPADRARRDIVTREVLDETRLIRFVAGPDGAVVPDLARRLPGRGLWVAADRASVDAAARKGLFARSAKAPLVASPDLAEQTAALLGARLLAGLGLARKAGQLVVGFEKVAGAVAAGKVGILIEAADGAVDGRRKILALARRQEPPPPAAGFFTSAELGLALGVETVIHTAFLAGQGARRWTEDARRLSGFRPLFPESWREEAGRAGDDPVPL
jgi:predicted RNA-binding protein YlxR (DUF448 family)